MDCQQAFALLQDILDKEASQIDEKEVRTHLEKCGHCFEKFRLEESIQEFLNEKIKLTASNESQPDRLESMRMNLMSQLDDIDAECTEKKNSSFGSSFKIFLATAALVVLAGIGYLSAEFFRHGEHYIPLEEAHWAVAETIAPYSSNFDKDAYIESIEAKMNYSLKTSFADYSFVGAKQEQIMNSEFEHIVFSNDNEYLSIFISNSDDVEIPEDVKSAMVKNGDITLYDHNCRGCRLVYHKLGSLVIITASTSKDLDLTQFIPGHLTI